MTRPCFALGALAALLLFLAATTAESSVRRHEESAPFPLLPDYMSDVYEQDARTNRAVAPRESLSQCAGDLWFGIQDSVSVVVDVTSSCISEQVDEVKFVLEDLSSLAVKAAGEVRDAISQCPQSGVRGCVSLVLGAAAREVKPIVLLVAKLVRLAVQMVSLGPLELLGCTMLPAILPAVWDTLMDVIIFAQCITQH